MLKKMILFHICTLFVVQIFAQKEFAPIGAKWYYGVIESLFQVQQGYLLFEVQGDTLIQTKQCRIVSSIKMYANGYQQYNENIILCYENHRVYYYQSNTFRLLYDFNAEVGETWTIRIPNEYYNQQLVNPDDTIRVITVDSISYVNYADTTLKLFYVHSSNNPSISGPDWIFWNPIIEGIGDKFLFPGVWGLWDIDIPYLRCYTDNFFSYTTNEKISCDTLITTNIIDQKILDIIKIYPNPTNGYLNVQSTSKTDVELYIYDITGKLMLEQNIKYDQVLILNNLNNGIYIIRCIDKMKNSKSNLIQLIK